MKLLALTLLLPCLIARAEEKDFYSLPQVVYETDDRCEASQAKEPWLQDAIATTFTLIKRSYLVVSGSYYEVQGPSLREGMKLCKSERFKGQKQAGFCSGFLVEDDLVVTAGHCFKNITKECPQTRFVLDYLVSSSDQEGSYVPKSSVFTCKEVLEKKVSEHSDFSLVRLDRPVKGRRLPRLRRRGSISVGAKVLAIGSPNGLPLKISRDAVVNRVSKKSFTANLDVYNGNSGSPVYNQAEHWIEGILIDGADDYVYDRSHDCYQSRRCTTGSPGCEGERMTAISEILPYLK